MLIVLYNLNDKVGKGIGFYMILAIIIFIVFILYLIIQFSFFKEYSMVMSNYNTLLKVLETRDLVLMRVLPEIKNKKTKDEITSLIAERIDNKKNDNDKIIELDVKINQKLDKAYSELDKSNNPIVKEELRRLVQFEKSLKTIRKEYTKSVDLYNEKILKHPKAMIKFWKMKPLNNYKTK